MITGTVGLIAIFLDVATSTSFINFGAFTVCLLIGKKKVDCTFPEAAKPLEDPVCAELANLGRTAQGVQQFGGLRARRR